MVSVNEVIICRAPVDVPNRGRSSTIALVAVISRLNFSVPNSAFYRFPDSPFAIRSHSPPAACPCRLPPAIRHSLFAPSPGTGFGTLRDGFWDGFYPQITQCSRPWDGWDGCGKGDGTRDTPLLLPFPALSAAFLLGLVTGQAR